ncbi:hypothetical protein BJ508DRAFT_330895 [Ascobolus immersus RN42]|uniref:Uncharacterized protein n=1 Tax=Ascobolus immersus RN42 TaxID=1160509 RepID=A0A3N4I470_ASCIM|nr:hypothetical protein BJ508DRAFT_330895 [Ascobolus immersus RN42]
MHPLISTHYPVESGAMINTVQVGYLDPAVTYKHTFSASTTVVEVMCQFEAYCYNFFELQDAGWLARGGASEAYSIGTKCLGDVIQQLSPTDTLTNIKVKRAMDRRDEPQDGPLRICLRMDGRPLLTSITAPIPEIDDRRHQHLTPLCLSRSAIEVEFIYYEQGDRVRYDLPYNECFTIEAFRVPETLTAIKSEALQAISNQINMDGFKLILNTLVQVQGSPWYIQEKAGSQFYTVVLLFTPKVVNRRKPSFLLLARSKTLQKQRAERTIRLQIAEELVKEEERERQRSNKKEKNRKSQPVQRKPSSSSLKTSMTEAPVTTPISDIAESSKAVDPVSEKVDRSQEQDENTTPFEMVDRRGKRIKSLRPAEIPARNRVRRRFEARSADSEDVQNDPRFILLVDRLNSAVDAAEIKEVARHIVEFAVFRDEEMRSRLHALEDYIDEVETHDDPLYNRDLCDKAADILSKIAFGKYFNDLKILHAGRKGAYTALVQELGARFGFDKNEIEGFDLKALITQALRLKQSPPKAITTLRTTGMPSSERKSTREQQDAAWDANIAEWHAIKEELKALEKDDDKLTEWKDAMARALKLWAQRDAIMRGQLDGIERWVERRRV